MSTWSRSAILACSFIFGLALTTPPPVGADCGSPDCNPFAQDCCKSDCTWEDTGAECVPRLAPCTKRTCSSGHDCNVGSSSNLPVGRSCVLTTDPCLIRECNGMGSCVNFIDENGNPFQLDRCADGEPCTNDAAACKIVSQNFAGCDYTGTQLPDETVCSTGHAPVCKTEKCLSGVCQVSGNMDPMAACSTFLNGNTCQVRTCGEAADCSGGVLGSVTCNPAVCKSRSCDLNGSTAVCKLTPLPQGASCDTNAWDCTHNICNSKAQCTNRDTTTFKDCDRDGATTAHCKLSKCDTNRNCRTNALYFQDVNPAVITLQMENEFTTSKNNRQFTTISFCADSNDGNPCTNDHCVGGSPYSDTCTVSQTTDCAVNDPCPVPTCGDICDVVSGSCTCRDLP
jgi:hypothetical protein